MRSQTVRHCPTQRGTLGPGAGGHTLFDRQSPKDDSELGEKLPELFDIHVMFFADTSSEGITALQLAFGLDRTVAEKLVADVPVLVKRAASPEVADALLDLLNNLGAQVVLMPSTATPSIVPADSNGGALAGGKAPWGGLDLQLPARGAASVSTAAKASPSLGAPAEDEDGEDEWKSGLTSHPPPAFPSVAPMPAPVPIAAPTPLPPAPIPAPAPLPAPVRMAAPDADGYAARFGDQRSAPLELAQLEPTPRVFPAGLRARDDSDGQLEAPLAAEAPARGRSLPPLPPSRTQSQKDVDLGLGSVPPLPALRAARGGPPSIPAARPAGPPPAPVRPAARAKPAAAAPEAARPRERVPSGSTFQAQLSSLADDPAGDDLQVVTPAAGDPYWSAKRRAQLTAGGAAPAPAASPAGPARSPLPAPDRVEREARPRSTETTAQRSAGGSGRFAALAILGGVLVLLLAARMEHSIFTGSANLGWMLLQGLALFAIGAGVGKVRK